MFYHIHNVNKNTDLEQHIGIKIVQHFALISVCKCQKHYLQQNQWKEITICEVQIN